MLKTPHARPLPAGRASLILAAGALALVFLRIPTAGAQFLGNVSPQSINPTILFNAATTTGISAVFPENVGQNVHILRYTIAGGPLVFGIQLDGSNDCTNFFPISAVATNTVSGFVTASGWYPCVTAEITALSGPAPPYQVTATYAGTSSTVLPTRGPYNTAGILHQTLAAVAPGNVSQGGSFNVQEVASAIIYFSYGAGCAGSTLAVNVGSNFQVANIATFNLANSVAIQPFVVPNFVGMLGSVVYTPGGGCLAANTVSIDIFFSSAELIPPAAPGPAPIPPPAFADFLFNYKTGVYEPRLVPTVYKVQSAVAVGAGADTTIWTPAAGKSFRVLGYRLVGSVNSPCSLKDNTAGAAFWRFVLTGMPGLNDTLTVNGFLSAAANNVLVINCTNALTLDGVVYGVEQ